MTTTAATATTTQIYRVYIKATPQVIWDAITKPEWTVRYGYGLRSDFDMRPGGPYRGLANEGMLAMGAPELCVDGEVIESDPPRKLVQTWRLLMDPETAGEGFTRLTYQITSANDGVSQLTVIHDLVGAPKLALMVGGGLEEMGAGGGWAWILSDLKTLIESGTQMASANAR